MWEALWVTALFGLILACWWHAIAPGEEEVKAGKEVHWSAPLGIVCITVVYIALLFVIYN